MNKYEYLNDTFGGKLTEIRVEKSLSQSSVASMANISTGYYSAIENNKRLPPPSETLARILLALNCTTNEAIYIQELAATERRVTPVELDLPAELQALIVDLRKYGSTLPKRSIHALRSYIRDALD